MKKFMKIIRNIIIIALSIYLMLFTYNIAGFTGLELLAIIGLLLLIAIGISTIIEKLNQMMK